MKNKFLVLSLIVPLLFVCTLSAQAEWWSGTQKNFVRVKAGALNVTGVTTATSINASGVVSAAGLKNTGAFYATDTVTTNAMVGTADFVATTTVPVTNYYAEVGDYCFAQIISTTADPVKLRCAVTTNTVTFYSDNATTASVMYMIVKKNN